MTVMIFYIYVRNAIMLFFRFDGIVLFFLFILMLRLPSLTSINSDLSILRIVWRMLKVRKKQKLQIWKASVQI